MRRCMLATAVALGLFVCTIQSARGQEVNATVRTHDGASYVLTDPWLEVDYTIGEPKETPQTPQGFQPSITVNASASASTGSTAPGGAEQSPLLSGHSRMADLLVSRQGVSMRIPWDEVQALRIARTPAPRAGLPTYVPSYRYTVAITLIGGEQVQADYINLGGAVLRGSGLAGRIEIPWNQLETLTFQR